MPPADAADSTIDLRGAWVAPGLVDAHAHVGWDDRASLEDNVRSARRALAAGVTTLREMGVPNWADVELRRRSHAGTEALPRILAAGDGVVPVVPNDWVAEVPEVRPFLTPAVPADTLQMLSPNRPWRIRGAPAIDTVVGSRASHGAQWVKVLATGRAFGYQADPRRRLFTDDELRTFVSAARRRGLLVGAHAHGDEGMRAAVLAGVRTIEHGTHASDATLRLMRDRGTCFVSTLTSWDDPQSATTPARGRALRAAGEDAARRARRVGVPVIVGTDGEYAEASPTVSDELAVLRSLGYSASETLLAATSRAARCLALGDRLGAVAPGREADLLVLDGDPREDLGRLGRPRLVLVGGRVVLDRR